MKINWKSKPAELSAAIALLALLGTFYCQELQNITYPDYKIDIGDVRKDAEKGDPKAQAKLGQFYGERCCGWPDRPAPKKDYVDCDFWLSLAQKMAIPVFIGSVGPAKNI